MASIPQRKPETEKALAPMAVAASKKEERSSAAPLSAEEIYRMIREAAYFKAEARGFAPGVELQDWLDAEKEVKQTLQAQ